MNDWIGWALGRARAQTLALGADVSPDRACLQQMPGEHHAAWILGHLLLGDAYLLVLLGAEPLAADFQTLLHRYGPGAIPQSSPARYDPIATLIERLEVTGVRRLAAVERMSVDDLRRPTPDPVLARAQPTLGHHLLGLVCHEGYHAGQLASWRRAHGWDPARWAFAPPPI